MKIRIREPCSREYLRIMHTENVKIHEKALRFCPLNYLSVVSKQLSRRLNGCLFLTKPNISAAVTLQPVKIIKVSVTSSDSFNFLNKSQLEKQSVLEEVVHFIEANKRKSVMVFTDGAVYDVAVGYGACAAVLVPLSGDEY